MSIGNMCMTGNRNWRAKEEYRMNKTLSERFLFVIWDKARKFDAQFINLLSSKFKVIDTYEVSWPRRFFTANLAAFYGWKGWFCWWNKARKCGRGPFLVIIVEDANPKWEYSADLSGHKMLLDKNVLIMKRILRKITGRSNLVHGSMTKAETSHELTALLSMDSNGIIPFREFDYGTTSGSACP